jgi:hypothetical protein
MCWILLQGAALSLPAQAAALAIAVLASRRRVSLQ